MNYRHAFHAGNHADVLKHFALALILDYLRAKPKSFVVIDTHAGRGRYDLAAPEALRSGEFRHGIARLLGHAPAALASYLDAVRALNPPGAFDTYPGSPLIAAAALRPGDRLIACELDLSEAAALAGALRPYRQARAEARDGYRALKALLPPPERRGLVLIDPPFERTDEFQTLAAALTAAWRRWPTGLYLVWYPLSDRAGVDTFLAALAQSGIKDMANYELLVRAPDRGAGLAGSGLIAINAAYVLGDAMRATLPVLARTLAQGPGAAWHIDRLSPE